MRVSNIVIGQRVTAAKRQQARQLRREMTPEERVLWQGLRGRQLAGLRFRRQQVVRGFIADFYCHSAGVVVEVDGGVHEQQMGYDEDRDYLLAGTGLRVLRVTNEEVRADLEGVLIRIAAFCCDGA